MADSKMDNKNYVTDLLSEKVNINAIDIYETVKDAKSIAISAHIKPDGDAIGSCLSMYFYLKKRIPDAEVKVFLEKPGPSFSGIPGYDIIDSSFEDDRIFDYFIMIDTVSQRLGDAKKIFDNAAFTINIDHHISNSLNECNINFIDPKGAAAAQLVYLCMDKTYLDKDIATLLYMGIAHDTGVFKYSNTSPETMLIAGKLLSYGFDFSDLLNVTYFEKSYAQLKVQGRVAFESRMFLDNQVIAAIVTKDFMDENGVTKNDFEGTVSQLLLTKGTRASIFMYEKEPGLFKASFRSNTDAINVSSVAVSLGGGGHVRAAGADVSGDPEKILSHVISLIKEQL